MSFDDLFEQRSLVAEQLKTCLRDLGYTKVSFSEKAGISRPTLDKLLNCGLDSKASFDRHLHKILDVTGLSVEELLLYTPINCPRREAVYSQNAPADYQMNPEAEKQYDLLQDILELCAIYY